MQRKSKTFLLNMVLVLAILSYEVMVAKGETYYYSSVGIIIISLFFLFVHFENGKPSVILLTMIASLCALAIVSRVAFFFLPQVKPIAAIVILAGIVFGSEVGFMTGAISAFVSNFYYGQGSWTPFQMFAFGLMGAIAGLLFYRKKHSNWQVILYGFLSVIVIYGGIVDINTIFFTSQEINRSIILAVYATAFPFNFVFGLSTAAFLAILKKPIQKRIERVCQKYCLVDKEAEK